MSDPLRPHGLQHDRLPCQSPSPRACSNSCPLSRWCHPTISSSVVPPQSVSASGSFPVSQLFTSGGQSIGASASPSVLPMNSQGWFPLGQTSLLLIISPQRYKGRGWMHCPCSQQSLGLSFLIMNEAPLGYLNLTLFNVQLFSFPSSYMYTFWFII